MREVILIRHAEVESRWKPICYGAMDVPLCESGLTASRQFASAWATHPVPACIFHSGLQRTETLARMISDHFPSTPIVIDARIRERDYGTWQGQSWDQIYVDHPDLDGLIQHPDTYCPHGGETTTQMQSRVVQWFESLPNIAHSDSGPIVAISHSGPIAALAGHCLGLHASQWQPWTVKTLESLCFRRCQVSRATNPTTDEPQSLAWTEHW